MARPKKEGFDYFPMDVHIFSDRKIRRLLSIFGAKGYLIYNYILCEIYRDNGCFMRCDENCAFDVADALKIKESVVEEVIQLCLSVGLFDKDVHKRVGVLTSAGIQSRYETMCNLSRRKSIVPKEIKIESSELTPINAEETPVNTEETPINSVESTQSKGKESKYTLSIGETEFLNFSEEKEPNDSEVEKEKSCGKKEKGFVPPSLEEVQKVAELSGKSRNFFEPWLAEEVALIFFTNATAKEWRNNDGLDMKNWHAYVQTNMIKAVRIEHQKKANNTNGNGNRKNYTKTTASSGTRIVEGDAINERSLRAASARTFQG